MDWKDLAGTVVKMGAPLIGGALFGPLGTAGGNLIGGFIASALGVDPTPEAVNNAITTGDPATIAAKLSSADQQFADKMDAIKAAIAADQAVQTTDVTSVNASIQAEVGHIDFWHWRNLLGYVVGFELLVFPTTTLVMMLLAKDTGPIIQYSTTSLVSILAIGAGLLGYVASDNTKRTTTALLGEHQPTIASAIASRIAKK